MCQHTMPTYIPPSQIIRYARKYANFMYRARLFRIRFLGKCYFFLLQVKSRDYKKIWSSSWTSDQNDVFIASSERFVHHVLVFIFRLPGRYILWAIQQLFSKWTEWPALLCTWPFLVTSLCCVRLFIYLVIILRLYFFDCFLFKLDRDDKWM